MGKRINLVVCQKSKVQDWVDHFRMNYDWIDDVVDLTNKKYFDLFKGIIDQAEYNPIYIVSTYIFAHYQLQI